MSEDPGSPAGGRRSEMGTAMGGKVVMVTGASSGIGRGTAEGLAGLGAHIVMVCRDGGRCARAVERIRAAVPGASLETMLADLSSQKAVQGLARDFHSRHDRLHVLINNAATVPRRRTLTVDGIEMQLAVNVLAPFMLSNLLLGALRAAAPSRVVMLSSGTHRRARQRLDDLQFECGYRAMKVYSHSKLLDLLLTRALAKRLTGTGVTVNALTPGLISTGLAREFGGPTRWLMNRFARPEEDGPRVPLLVATSPTFDRTTGAYVNRHGELDEPSPDARDEAAAERLWGMCKGLTGMHEPDADNVRERLI